MHSDFPLPLRQEKQEEWGAEKNSYITGKSLMYVETTFLLIFSKYPTNWTEY